MRTLNRLSWLLLGVAVLSLVMALALVAAVGVLLHASLDLLMVWAALAVVIAFRLLTGEQVASPPAQPPSRPEPEVRLEDLELLHRMWQRGDIGEAAYRRAVAQATRRYSPPPPVPDRRPRWR